jgi:hypothetical protein
MGHLFRMQELDSSSMLIFLKPGSTRSVGKPKLKWFESVVEDLKKMGVRNCEVTRRIANSGGQFGKREAPRRTITSDEE